MRATLLPLSCGLILALVGLETVSVATADDATRPRNLPTAENVAKQIDRRMASAWKAAGIKPRKPAADAEFLRRATLDLTGRIPTEVATRKFLANKKGTKRAALVGELLRSKDYARTQAQRWSQLMVGRTYLARQRNYAKLRRGAQRMREMMGGGKARDDDMYVSDENLTFDEWLTERIHTDAPWDSVAREVISAEGTVDKNPAGHYMLRYARDGKAAEMTGSVMRVFQGLQVQCSQCHDDPYDRWTQRDFWGIAAFFARTTARRTPPPAGSPRKRPNGQRVRGPFRVFDRGYGQARMPADQGEVGALVLPKFLTGDVINPSKPGRRGELARMVTAADNPYFAKATVNRVWSHYFGRGIVNPVDELTEEDYPHPDVLDLLAEDFKASGYDLRRLTQIIVNTRAYGLSSAGPEDGRDEELAMFARAPLRSLSAEQLFYSVLEATGVEGLASNNRLARRQLERRKYQLLQQFVRTFGDNDDEEVVDQGTIPEALMLLNGPLTNDAVRPRPRHPVYDRLFAMEKVEQQINTIYLRVLTRPATRAERNKVKKYLLKTKGQGPTARAQAYADVFWALLNSAEFNLIH